MKLNIRRFGCFCHHRSDTAGAFDRHSLSDGCGGWRAYKDEVDGTKLKLMQRSHHGFVDRHAQRSQARRAIQGGRTDGVRFDELHRYDGRLLRVEGATATKLDGVVDYMKSVGVGTVGYIGYSDGWGDLVYGGPKKVGRARRHQES
jgi:hypothetical protein